MNGYSHLSSADASTLLVSLSDKLYNARAILSDYYEIGDDLWQRFNDVMKILFNEAMKIEREEALSDSPEQLRNRRAALLSGSGRWRATGIGKKR